MNLQGSMFGPRRAMTGDIRLVAVTRSEDNVLVVSMSPVGRKTIGITVSFGLPAAVNLRDSVQ